MTTMDRMKKVLDDVFAGDADFAEIKDEARLREDLGMNSVAMLYMALGLEGEFGIKFRNTDFADLVTVGDVVRCIEGKLK